MPDTLYAILCAAALRSELREAWYSGDRSHAYYGRKASWLAFCEAWGVSTSTLHLAFR
jgi:hypothetical protein